MCVVEFRFVTYFALSKQINNTHREPKKRFIRQATAFSDCGLKQQDVCASKREKLHVYDICDPTVRLFSKPVIISSIHIVFRADDVRQNCIVCCFFYSFVRFACLFTFVAPIVLYIKFESGWNLCLWVLFLELLLLKYTESKHILLVLVAVKYIK